MWEIGVIYNISVLIYDVSYLREWLSTAFHESSMSLFISKKLITELPCDLPIMNIAIEYEHKMWAHDVFLNRSKREDIHKHLRCIRLFVSEGSKLLRRTTRMFARDSSINCVEESVSSYPWSRPGVVFTRRMILSLHAMPDLYASWTLPRLYR